MSNANENNKKSIFQERFKELVGDTATQEVIAKKANTSRQNVGNWLKGKSKPDINALAEIAKGYKVSTDWLLGLTDIKTSDTKIKDICEYTGLSENAIKSFTEFKDSFDFEDYGECMSEIMETHEFKKIFGYIWLLEDTVFTEFYLQRVSDFFYEFAQNDDFSIELRNNFFKRFSNAFGFSADSIYANEDFKRKHPNNDIYLYIPENHSILNASHFFQVQNDEKKDVYEYGAIKQLNKTIERYISLTKSDYMTKAMNNNEFISGFDFDYTFNSKEEEQSFRQYILDNLNKAFENKTSCK